MRDTTLHEFRRCTRDIDEKSILSANLKYSICCFGRIFDFHPVDETDHGSQKRKKGGGWELKNIQSLSSRRFVRGDTWLCKYFHFKYCQGQRSSFTRGLLAALPETYIEFWSMCGRGQPVFLVRISLARVTPPRGLSSWGTGNPVFHSITDQLLKSCWESFYGTERTILTRVICLTSNSDSLPVWTPCDFGLEGRSMIRSAR